MTPSERKAELRQEALARRDDFTRRPGAVAEAIRHVAMLALHLPELAHAHAVGGYWPIRTELDPRPLLAGLAARDLSLLSLPVVTDSGLSFRRWTPGDMLEKAGFGTFGPGPTALEITPRALLVPTVVFDRGGNRIGHGKGHYDRAIARLRAQGPLTVIGLAYAVQETDAIPAEPHDCVLDIVVTEHEVIRPVVS